METERNRITRQRTGTKKVFDSLTVWTISVALVFVIINLSSQPEQFMSPWTIINVCLTLICLVMLPRYPRLAWWIYVSLFAVMSLNSEYWPAALTLIAPIVAALAAYKGHMWEAALGSIIIWYAGSINPKDGKFLPHDLLASSIWAMFLALAVVIGYVLCRIIIQRKTLLSQWENDIQSRREKLALTLHDSVATSLTSVVIRAETLSLRDGLANEDKAELEKIADQARSSMKEVRNLLNIMDDRLQPHTTSIPSAISLVNTTIGFLQSHGFVVEVRREPIYTRFTGEVLLILDDVLKEVAINIIKYSVPGSQVTIEIKEDVEAVELSFTNTVNGSMSRPHLSTGLGLQMIAQLVETVQGKVRTVSNLDRWTIKLQFPRS